MSHLLVNELGNDVSVSAGAEEGERVRRHARTPPPLDPSLILPAAGKVQGRRVQALERGAEHAGYVSRCALARAII